MSTHAAKTAALMAYDLDLLSPDGRARLERHLERCAVCAGELRSIRAYEALASEARAKEWREPDWDRMDLALRREAKDVARATKRDRTSGRTAIYGALAAAAAVILVVGGGMLVPDTAANRPEPRAAVALALVDGAAREGTVTALAGQATVDGRALALGDVIAESARLVTAAGSATHVRLADGTGFVLAAETTARLDRSRERTTVLTLESGSVTSRVAHLEQGARYEVEAAPYVIHVRGTHFTVARSPDAGVSVSVREGVVEVTQGETVVARVVAPSRWAAPAGPATPAGPAAPAGPATPEATGAPEPGTLVEPIALAPNAVGWPIVRIPTAAGVTRIDFDGVSLPLAGAIAMRASVGPHEGLAYGLSGTPVRFAMVVGPEGMSLDPTLMLAPPASAEPRRGTLDPAVVRGVVTRGMDGVQRCYRTALMRRPDLAGRMALRITVDPSGHVSRATLASTATPYEWLSTCVENQASAWAFPAPTGGGAVSLSLPLDFASE